jgi:hypothetical protein
LPLQALPEIYEPEELNKLFDSTENEHLYLTFDMLLKCGLRQLIKRNVGCCGVSRYLIGQSA